MCVCVYSHIVVKEEELDCMPALMYVLPLPKGKQSGNSGPLSRTQNSKKKKKASLSPLSHSNCRQ
jgi:hypothetical protein